MEYQYFTFSVTWLLNIPDNIPNNIPNNVLLAHSAFQTDGGQGEEEKNFKVEIWWFRINPLNVSCSKSSSGIDVTWLCPRLVLALVPFPLSCTSMGTAQGAFSQKAPGFPAMLAVRPSGWALGAVGAPSPCPAWRGSIPMCDLGFKLTPQIRSDPDLGAGINPHPPWGFSMGCWVFDPRWSSLSVVENPSSYLAVLCQP